MQCFQSLTKLGDFGWSPLGWNATPPKPAGVDICRPVTAGVFWRLLLTAPVSSVSRF